jgi:hypothetical protein
MGNKCCPASIKILDCIYQLQEVENTLQQLIHRYEAQILQQKKQIMARIHDKPSCLVHLRTVCIIKHHKHQLELKLTGCMQKRYHLKMHIEAVKTTTFAFRTFLQQHSVERVEALQENITEMIDHACEINEALSQDVGDLDLNEEELEDEYNQLIAQPDKSGEIYPTLPEVPTTNPRARLLSQPSQTSASRPSCEKATPNRLTV